MYNVCAVYPQTICELKVAITGDNVGLAVDVSDHATAIMFFTDVR